MGPERPLLTSLEEAADLAEAVLGGKAAKLAWVSQSVGLPVPAGFAITTRAFHRLIEFNNLASPIAAELAGLDIHCPASLDAASDRIGWAIRRAAIPQEIVDAVHDAVDRLQADVQQLLDELPQIQKKVTRRVRELNREASRRAIDLSLQHLRKKYQDLPAVLEYLDALEQDVLENADDFRSDE